ncbi:MAG: rhomboid family intramembrane serine protease [Bacteroidota bacterium]
MKLQFQDIKLKYDNANVIMKIIYITAAVFILTFLNNSISFLSNSQGNFMIDWFALSPHFEQYIIKPWTIITYGFMHEGIFHILFNLLILYYFGNLFLNFFNEKQLLIYYFFGILFGGIVFMLSYNYIPALQTKRAVLVGASAGVTAVLIGIATHIPNYVMRFQFIGNVKLKIIAIIIVVLDIIQIPNGNAGGHLAHLGGALTGFLLTNNFNSGKDFITWSEQFLKTKKQKPFKTVYKNKKAANTNVRQTDDQQRKIDEILDKISKSGYEALSKEDKDFLFKIGKN